MLGAIIGDVVGSTYEFHNTKDYNFELFPKGSEYTDDTIMSLAVASTLMKVDYSWLEMFPYSFEEEMVRLANLYPYPKGGYGGGFATWLFHPEELYSYDCKDAIWFKKSSSGRFPYGSYGNGSAMRVSPVGWFYNGKSGEKKTYRISTSSAIITHNSREGSKGANAVAIAIYLARKGKTKEEIREYLEGHFEYDLHKTWEYWHPIYKWDSSCQGTVPQAIICFLDSTDFEDAIRKAVSLGGDSDTLACITGGIAEAFYKEIPINMVQKTLEILPNELKDILFKFQKTVGIDYKPLYKVYFNESNDDSYI